jgi:alpha-D-xyloside xylohydrolase
MAESLRGGLSLGMSGFSFWSVDIGGFEGRPNAAIYKRWVQFGLMCSHSRLHGSNSYRVPWLIDDDDKSDQGCSAVLRKFTQLKCRLMPYLYSEAMRAIENGWPTSVRHMALEFPQDRTAWTCDAQFMLGSSILVAPVFCESGEVEFYLPEGTWVNFWDGNMIQGPQWVKETHDFTTLPMYVREGTVLVMGREDETRTDYDWMDAGQRVVKDYGDTERVKFELWDSRGEVSEVVFCG